MQGFYINLGDRKDRLQHFNELQRRHAVFKNLKRYPAYKSINGSIGCAKSHIAALDLASALPGEYIMICEDDLMILKNFTLDKILNENATWDILTLTPFFARRSAYNHEYDRVTGAQTTTCYVVKKTFIPTLRETFESALEHLEEGNPPEIFSIDQAWKNLQKDFIFISPKERIASQLESYSDILNKVVNYSAYSYLVK